MVDVFDTSFNGLSPAEIIVRLSIIADLLSKHPAFRDGCPEFVYNPDKIRALGGRFHDALNAAANKDLLRIAEKNEIRAEIDQAMIFVGQYLVMFAAFKKDPSLLQNTGLTLRKRGGKKTVKKIVSDKPEGLRVRHHSVSGGVIVSANAMPLVASFELSMTTKDPNDESTWGSVGSYFHCSKIEVLGLQPGTTVFFRLRFITATGPGPWSTVVSIIVI